LVQALRTQRRQRPFLLRGQVLKMKMRLLVVLLAVAVVGTVSAQGADTLVRFSGGIGVIPVANVVAPANPDGTFPNVTRNIVRNVNPGATIWRIADLKADIDVFGRIKVRGKGLLVGSGNSIGSNANQSVFATLICEAKEPFVEHSTDKAGVPLDVNGDFRIDDFISSPVSTCASPVLLIRNVPAGVWFAAGVPKFGEDNN
jgi:hypothetical protein